MSWFSKNYEKAALGGAAAIALGIAYMGWSKYSNVGSEFSTDLKGKGNNNAAVRDADLIDKAVASMKLDRTWSQAMVGDREVDLFTGIALFVPSAAPETTVDPRKDAPIHDPIPNTWWLTNRLDPGFADSPTRDPDGDGFSNMEEFKAKTDPNDVKSIPSLIAKLMYVRDESLTWVIRPSYGSDGKFPFNYLDTKGGQNKTGAADMIEPNGLFFAKGMMKDRFKFLGSEVRKEMNKKTNIEVDVTYVRIEDQRANKKGTVYEFPAPLSEERINEHQKFDRTAVFSLEALGLGGKEFKVEENMKFALPPDAATKDYLLKSVTPGSVVVEYSDAAGATKSVEVSKGGMAAATE